MTPNRLVVLGGGPAGYAAAQEGAARGLVVTLVEGRDLGGTCLNRGCIPTKFLLAGTKPAAELEWIGKAGLAEGELRFSLPALRKRHESFIAASRKAMIRLLKQWGVTLAQGRGRFLDQSTIEVEGVGPLGFDHCVLATGSRPAAIPGLAADGRRVLDSDGLLLLDDVPESLIIVGGGAIGLEMAEIFHRLGTRITLVEGKDRLAPTEDPEVGTTLAALLKRRGMDVHVGAKVESLSTENDRAVLVLASGERLEAALALTAVGRAPASDGLNLEALGATTRGPGFVNTDACLRATPGVYAVGDVNGLALLAHAASDQAKYAARCAAGLEQGPYSPGVTPWCIFGTHEAMRAGLTAAELMAQGRPVETSKAMLAANPLAQAHGDTRGFIKIVWSEDRVVGVTALGHDVSHLAGLAQAMVAHAWKKEDSARLIFGHPMLEESLETALHAQRVPCKES